jgi:hypothetical protein
MGAHKDMTSYDAPFFDHRNKWQERLAFFWTGCRVELVELLLDAARRCGWCFFDPPKKKAWTKPYYLSGRAGLAARFMHISSSIY